MSWHNKQAVAQFENEWSAEPGFYWGDNNPKDLDVRLENHPDPTVSRTTFLYSRSARHGMEEALSNE